MYNNQTYSGRYTGANMAGGQNQRQFNNDAFANSNPQFNQNKFQQRGEGKKFNYLKVINSHIMYFTLCILG